MQTLEEIKSHLRTGDYSKVGELAGVSRDYAHKLLKRPKSKKFKDVFEAAKLVAISNQNLGL